MEYITSIQNPHIREIRLLQKKKYRQGNGKFFIEGIKFVKEALEESTHISKVIISERLDGCAGSGEVLQKIRDMNLHTLVVPHNLFTKISDTKTPQGILAVLNMHNYKVVDLYDKKNFFVILDGIQDPGNMGTIIRTADAVGATGIVSTKGCVDIYNPKVLRATMGSLFRIPICYSEDVFGAIDDMKARGIRICAAHPRGDVTCFEMNLIKNIAIVIGNEARGISEEIRRYADVLVRIPMVGKAESLNASVAASILMYEILRKGMMELGERS